MEGLIIKILGGFYYVRTAGSLYTCRARGNFRKRKLTPLVGDYVAIRVISEETKEGYVEEIKERRNFLVRPPVANIDRLIIVSAAADPAPDTAFIDKLIIICEYNHIEPILCFNKIDLKHDPEIYNEYSKLKYKIVFTSVPEKIGLEEIKEITSSGITAAAGFSGVGKSSILNTVISGASLQTGSISQKVSRGKHTTRYIELYELDSGGFLADTPGFSNLDIEMINAKELSGLFTEFDKYSANCLFGDCSHTKEKGCAVIEAVDKDEIPRFRHENYCSFYDKLIKIKDWERK